MSKTEKVKLIRNAALLYLVAVMLAIAATFGWFSYSRKVNVESGSNENIAVSANSGNLKISLDGSAYGQSIRVERQLPSYIDISGSGENLFYPKSLNSESNPILSDISSFTEVTGNTDYYLELRLSFQATAAMSVYLDSSSFVSGIERYLSGSTEGSYARRSLYGDISCDGIAGAVRVAFLSVEGENPDGSEILELKMLWIPNDNIELYYETDADGHEVAFLKENGTPESSTDEGYRYLEKDSERNIMTEKKITVNDYINGKVRVGSDGTAIAETGCVKGSVPLLSFNEKGENARTGELVVRVWFEGTDRESDKALNGGAVKYNFGFIGIDKSPSDVSLSGTSRIDDSGNLTDELSESEKCIYFNQSLGRLCWYSDKNAFNTSSEQPVSDGEILYSKDGINWTQYSGDGNTSLCMRETEQIFYIKTTETAGTLSSNAVAVTVPPLPAE